VQHLRESEWRAIVHALEAHLRLQVQAFVRPKEWAFDVTHAARLFDLDALVCDLRPSHTAGRVVAAVEAARTRALPALDLYVRERSPTARCEARAAVMAATEALVGIADTTHAAGGASPRLVYRLLERCLLPEHLVIWSDPFPDDVTERALAAVVTRRRATGCARGDSAW
jgi:hypothetical protein